MFDDLESEAGAQQDEEKSSIALERWAHFPAIAAFGLLMLLCRTHPWRWQIAVGGCFTVYVFWFALGSGKKDLDDITGDSEVGRKIAISLLPHTIILALVVLGVSWWFRLRPILPTWLTVESRKGSLWMLLGWLLLALTGILEGSWLASRIRRKFPDGEG